MKFFSHKTVVQMHQRIQKVLLQSPKMYRRCNTPRISYRYVFKHPWSSEVCGIYQNMSIACHLSANCRVNEKTEVANV
jgi:hypothetical protein